jgi:hypothetical protein
LGGDSEVELLINEMEFFLLSFLLLLREAQHNNKTRSMENEEVGEVR